MSEDSAKQDGKGSVAALPFFVQRSAQLGASLALHHLHQDRLVTIPVMMGRRNWGGPPASPFLFALAACFDARLLSSWGCSDRLRQDVRDMLRHVKVSVDRLNTNVKPLACPVKDDMTDVKEDCRGTISASFR